MADNILRAIITADGSKFIKTIDVLEKELKQFEAQLKTTTSVTDFNRLNSEIAKTKQQLDRLRSGASIGASGMKSLAGSSNQATQSLIGLGRVVQDAPFGFLGIANNLNPLLESFQRLKASTGSTGTALKALGASLTGPAGIGIALSVVSSLLIVFGDKLFGGAKASRELDGELAMLAKTANDAKDALEAFNKQADFLKEIGAVAVDISFSGDFERSALKLQQQSILLDESILKVEGSLKKVSTASSAASSKFFESASRSAIEAANKFGGISEIPDKIAEGFSKADQKIIESNKALQKDFVALSDELDKQTRKRSVVRAQIRLNNITKERKDLEEELKKQKDAYEKYVNDTISKGKELAKFFEGRRETVPFFSVFDSKDDQFKKAKKFIDEVKSGIEDFDKIIFRLPATIEPIFPPEAKRDLIEQFRERVKDINEEFKKGTGLAGIEVPLPAFIRQAQDTQDKNIKETQKLQDSYVKLGASIAEVVRPAFDGLFEAMENGSNALQGFLQGLANALKKIVEQLIATAAVAGILSLISGGAAAKGGLSFFGAFKKLMGGTSSIGGGGGSISSIGSGGGQVQFSISGNNLIGVLNNAGRSQGRLI